jgi:Protein of unknown function (DUF2975)
MVFAREAAMSNVFILDPVAEQDVAPAYRKLRPISRVLSWLSTIVLSGFALWTLAATVIALFFAAYVQMNVDGANISMGLHGEVPHAIAGMVRLSDQPAITRLSGIVDVFVAMTPLIFVFWHLRGLFSLYAGGIVFARENAQHLKRIGIWLIVYPFAKLAANMLFQAAGGLDHRWFYIEEVYALGLGAIVVAIAQVMEFGHEIEQEKDSFI